MSACFLPFCCYVSYNLTHTLVSYIERQDFLCSAILQRTLSYQKMWSKGPNFTKTHWYTRYVFRHFVLMSIIVVADIYAIHQITGFFMLFNIGITLPYWKMWSRGLKLVKIKNMAAILENGRQSLTTSKLSLVNKIIEFSTQKTFKKSGLPAFPHKCLTLSDFSKICPVYSH